LTVGKWLWGVMPKRSAETSERILDAARIIVREVGPDKLTFDAVAARIGVTKQAVIYWFPNKARLIEALVRPALEAEATTGRSSLRKSACAQVAIRDFVQALAVFHMADLDRFRLMYVAPQIGRRSGRAGMQLTTLGRLHPATTAMYDVLAERLVSDGRYTRMIDARRAASAIHSALIGLLLRMAMSDSLNAPLRHRDHALIEALLEVLAPEPEVVL